VVRIVLDPASPLRTPAIAGRRFFGWGAYHLASPPPSRAGATSQPDRRGQELVEVVGCEEVAAVDGARHCPFLSPCGLHHPDLTIIERGVPVPSGGTSTFPQWSLAFIGFLEDFFGGPVVDRHLIATSG
jgi:hypothetical protein